MLADELKAPISWTDGSADVQDFLDKLQGNILKGHGRSHTVNLFCRFRDDAKQAATLFMREQAGRVKSAKDQLLATAERKATGQLDTAPFVCIFLTKAGYDYFGVAPAEQPAGAAFRAGMGATSGLNDPPKANWSTPLRDPHVLVLVGLMSMEESEQEATSLLNQIGEIGDIHHHMSGDIIGGQYFNSDGNGIENFGYVDGRSQPLVLVEEETREAAEVASDPNVDGHKAFWPNTRFPVDQFVVRDPGSADPAAYGSYFVFRQLEQNVAGFKSAEDEVNKKRTDASLHGNADSMTVGRQENGTPMEREIVGNLQPVSNAFLFDSNPPRCPHFSHIRKVNPRTDATQKHLMIRRGITYGFRADRHIDAQGRFVLPDEPLLPRKGVGLLFQSYQASIEDQFEVAQVDWANKAGRADDPAQLVGVDPVIGQPGPSSPKWPAKYGADGTEVIEFFKIGKKGPGPFVKLLGGGYFFAPSLDTLANIWA